MCECFADLCLVAGCGDISSNVLCRMVHHAGSQGFGRCSLSSLFFFLQLYISCFRLVLGIGIRDTADTVSLQFLWIALPPFNYTQVSSANHMVPVAFISIWMRTSKDIQIQDDPSNAAKNHIFYQTVLAFESLLYYRISVVVLLQGLSKFLQRALPECVP